MPIPIRTDATVCDRAWGTFATFYLVWNFVWALLFSFETSSEFLHLLGALAGLGAVFVIRAGGWWYEPPEDEVAGDVRVRIAPTSTRVGPVVPPLELD